MGQKILHSLNFMFSEKNSPPVGVVIRINQAVLDRSVSGDFRQQAAQEIAGSEGPVSIDCTRVGFVDSSGVGALLHINNSLPDDRRPVVLLGASREVVALLELLRVDHLFKLVQPD